MAEVPNRIIMDEWILKIHAPTNLSAIDAEAIRQVLTGNDLIDQLTKTINDTAHTFQELQATQFTLTR